MMQKDAYPFDLSVIIPVYNAEAYLARCIASLDAQTMPQERFEVILVNDGSTDESLELARGYADERPGYAVIDQPNGGVSAARNAGIAAAHGRYLIFLDPDDELSSPSIEALVTTFDQLGDAVDLVTYPLTYHDAVTGKERRHKRQEWLTKTGAYDLQEYPQLVQTTVNVCIRNLGADTPRFDETIRLGEDQRFNTELLASKAVLGYCHEAEYVYWRYTNTAATRHLTTRTFEGLIGNYERYIELARTRERFARYAHALVIYETSWRIRQDELLPHDADEQKRELCQRRMDAVLAAIPFESWLESPYLSDTLRVYQLQRYGKLEQLEGIDYDADGTHLHFHSGIDLKTESPRITLTWAVRKQRGFLIRGYVHGQSFLLESKPMLSAVFKGSTRELEVRRSLIDNERTSISITKVWEFEVELPVFGSVYDCVFLLSFGERSVPAFDVRFDLLRTNGRMINAHMREFGELRLTIEGQRLHVGTIKDLPRWTMPAVMPLLRLHDKGRTGNYDAEKVNELRQRLPKELREQKGRRVWLYDDGSVGQGALSRMLDDIQARDGVTRYYVADDANAAAAVKTLGGRAVIRGSFDHVLWFLQAEKVISSLTDLGALCPCDKAVFERVRDFTRADQCYVLVGEGYDLREAAAFDVVVT